jgi:hypothetical protein
MLDDRRLHCVRERQQRKNFLRLAANQHALFGQHQSAPRELIGN